MSGSDSIVELGEFELQSGKVLPNLKISHKAFGTLNPARSNAILLPTFYGGKHTDYEEIIGQGKALDPAEYFIVAVDMMCNGLSSSPSNTIAPLAGPDFPHITHWDNVHAQKLMLEQKYGIESLALVSGFSMGGQQANHWAAIFPDRVERMISWCGSAATSPHNWVFLEGVKAGLLADPAFEQGHYKVNPEAGIRAFARIWAGWGPSQAFYRRKLHRQLGQETAADHMAEFWEPNFLAFDANDLMGMLHTWQVANIADNIIYNGDYAAACGAITAKTILMPCLTDLYFPVADNEIQVDLMSNAELRPIPSDWGHIAGGPGLNPEDSSFIDQAHKELLAS